MRAFGPDVDLAFEAPMTPERLLLNLHPEIVHELSRTGPPIIAESQ
jgi:hypothetical protein